MMQRWRCLLHGQGFPDLILHEMAWTSESIHAVTRSSKPRVNQWDQHDIIPVLIVRRWMSIDVSKRSDEVAQQLYDVGKSIGHFFYLDKNL
jgi:hypothetical protein